MTCSFLDYYNDSLDPSEEYFRNREINSNKINIRN